MAQANTHQTSNKCPRCGRTFASVEQRLEHERNRKSSGKTAEGATNNEKTKMDMIIEDRFEATVN